MNEAKTKKKKVGNHKIYPVREILEKYNLSPAEFQTMAQSVLKPTHMTTQGITSVGLMMIGKAVKKLKREAKEQKDEVERNTPTIVTLLTCGQPPNKLKLWCECPHTGSKVVVNVSRRVHAGYKAKQALLCEKIAKGLYVHPPIQRA